MEDWIENPNACNSVDEEEKSWEYDGTFCFETVCTRTNLYLPKMGEMRDVLRMEGDMCVDPATTTVDDSICCEEIT